MRQLYSEFTDFLKYKMSLGGLPEELLRIILQKLDLKSIQNLYDAGNLHLQTVICTPGVIKSCKLSLSSMATALTLATNFFRNVSLYLLELDLTAVKDLTKTALLPVIKRMNCLLTLNVAYTKITIFDFLVLYDHCPSIKNISINYTFNKSCNDNIDYSNERLQKCQNVFANIENIQFVGSCENLWYSKLPQFILHKAKLNSLTYILAKQDEILKFSKELTSPAIVCNTFSMYNLAHRRRFQPSIDPVLNMPNAPQIVDSLLTNYEYIYICANESRMNQIQCSSVFKDFFTSNSCMGKAAYSLCYVLFEPQFKGHLHKNCIILFWNKKTTNFNEAFFRHLTLKLKPLLPYLVPTDKMLEPGQSLNDWIWVKNPICKQLICKNEETLFKKRRISTPSVKIDLDNLLKDKKKVELNIYFLDCVQHVVTLSTNSNYLKKVSFLKLTGPVRYSIEFFNILFRCCENLETIDVEAPSVSPCVQSISRSVALSRSLKNLRIVDKTIDFNTLFSSLSQCRTLQNVILIDESNVKNDLGKPDSLIRQCENLYYLCIEASLSESAQKNRLALFNKCKTECERHYLIIDIVIFPSEHEYSYDPFVDVFKLNQNKVIV